MDWLTIIQIAGISLAGAGGALATFTETRDEDEKHPGKKHLNGTGWLAIILTGIGIILGVTGQVIANNESKSDTETVLNKLVEQGNQSATILTNLNAEAERSQKSLSYIERMGMRLEKLEFTAEYELDTNTEALVALHYRVKAIMDALPPGVMRVFPISLDEALGPLTKQQPAGNASSSAAALSSQLAEWRNFLSSPGLVTRLFSGFTPRIDVNSIDLNITFKPGDNEPYFEYVRAKDRVKVVWKYSITASDWRATERMSSVQDLANAGLFMNPLNCPESLRPHISPLSVTLDFEKASITVTNFTKSIILGAAAGPRPLYDDDVAFLPASDIVINSALWENKRPVRPPQVTGLRIVTSSP